MIPDCLEQVLFMGAGASAPLGLPRMDDLILPRAARALRGWDRRASASERRVAEYLELVHGIGRRRSRRRWPEIGAPCRASWIS